MQKPPKLCIQNAAHSILRLGRFERSFDHRRVHSGSENLSRAITDNSVITVRITGSDGDEFQEEASMGRTSFYVRFSNKRFFALAA